MYSVCSWIQNQILSHFELSKFQIDLPKAEKIKLSNFDEIAEKMKVTQFLFFVKIYIKNQFKISARVR